MSAKVANAANLLDPEEIKRTQPPCKLGYRFRFTGVFDKNIEVLRLINKATFPVNYKDSFYQQVIANGPDFNYLGTFLCEHIKFYLQVCMMTFLWAVFVVDWKTMAKNYTL